MLKKDNLLQDKCWKMKYLKFVSQNSEYSFTGFCWVSWEPCTAILVKYKVPNWLEQKPVNA